MRNDEMAEEASRFSNAGNAHGAHMPQFMTSNSGDMTFGGNQVPIFNSFAPTGGSNNTLSFGQVPMMMHGGTPLQEIPYD